MREHAMPQLRFKDIILTKSDGTLYDTLRNGDRKYAE